MGTIASQPAILLAERAAFSNDRAYLSGFASSIAEVRNLSANDIYSWFLANTGVGPQSVAQPPDLKLSLISPCTEQHIKKYEQQGVRTVTETPEIYRQHVRPYMQSKRGGGRLDWVWNIIEGRKEQEDIMYREHGEEGFLLTPDL